MELKSSEKEVEFKASVGEDGKVVLKKKVKIDEGRKSKVRGGQFELRVRKDLEEKGWVVDKWSNNVSPGDGSPRLCTPQDSDNSWKDWKLVPCKRVFRPVGGGRSVMTIGTGFPDFVCFDRRDNLFEVIGVEVKMNGSLSREEKEKCCWLLENGIFGQILVASKKKVKNRVRVEYLDFLEVRKGMRASD